ncbi:MAG TPA: hypothetical protein VF529_19600 [Solirubrobacteraceae bacterium]
MEAQRGGAGLTRALLVGASVLALSGCGGDEEDAPSRDEFAASAEKVCAALDRQSRELSRSRPKSNAEIVAFARDARRAAQDAVRRVAALAVPEGEDGEKARRWQDAVEQEAEEQLIPALDRLETAAEEGDEQEILSAALEIQGLEAQRSDQLAREIGAEGCAA